jgi:hypothetical protein
MSLHIRHQIDVSLSRRRGLHRRDFLRGVSAASVAAGTLSWHDLVTLQAAEINRRGKACIILWMTGGPSHFETFSPKPGHENGGETKAISTSVPGIEVSENFPEMAKVMHHAAIIRSMTSKEGSHPRATYMMHTGYLPNASVKYPSFGSIVAQQIASTELDLPAFVRIGRNTRDGAGGGILGIEYDPFLLTRPGTLPTNAQPATNFDRYDRRLGLLGRLDASYAGSGGKEEVAEHQRLYQKAARMIKSSQMTAFDLEKEPAEVREAYGESDFGSGCLLARRLVETGVPCVEVVHANWDTHFDNFTRVKELAGEVDRPFAYLLTDLHQRGMLENTVVLWTGEFGRTPRINPRTGRDHYPRAFNSVLAGGGIRGGQVIGSTDAGGSTVEERPVGVTDLLQTLCMSLEIDSTLENIAPNGRPIRIVDDGAPVSELFG